MNGFKNMNWTNFDIIRFIEKMNIWICIMIFFSSALFTYWLLINYDSNIALVSMTVSGLLSAILYNKKRHDVVMLVNTNKKSSICLALFILYMLYSIKVCKGTQDIQLGGHILIRTRYIPLVFISMYFYAIIALDFIKRLIKDFIEKLSLWDRQAYAIASVIITAIIIFLYSKNSGWYMQYDGVYSLDSGWCFNKIFPVIQYYDIRHPLLSIFTFPIYVFMSLINQIFIPENMWGVTYAIGIQFFNSQLLITTGLMIKKITDDSKEIFVLFICSYSVIMYLFMFEKYQLCVFLLVLYVYCQCSGKNKESLPVYVASAFVMPTSAFCGISYIWTDRTIKKKIKDIGKIGAYTLCGLICLGRGSVLITGLNEAFAMKSRFGSGEWLLTQKLISLSKLWQGVFFPVNATTYNETSYFWVHLTDRYEGIFILLLLLTIIGIITHRKELYIKTCIGWLVFSFILVVVLQWSVSESPLFSLYFAWALIPAVKYGIDYLIGKLKLNYKILYRLMFVLLIVTAFIDLSKIQLFLDKIYK